MSAVIKKINDIHAVVGQKLKQHERHISAGALLLGAYFDAIFLPRIDSGITYVLIGAYLVIVTFLIIFSAILLEHFSVSPVRRRIAGAIDIIIPFIIGSLLSAIFVYYSRSSSLVASAPFMAFLALIILLIELVRSRLRLLELRIALLYFILIMNMTFAIPVLMGFMGPMTFAVGIASALFFIFVVLLCLFKLSPNIFRSGRVAIILSIVGITMLMNLLYFFRLIPPIPLALRVAEATYGVERNESGGYTVLLEANKKIDIGIFSVPTIKIGGGPLYFFSAVFAPVRLETSIVHVWQFYDEKTSEWMSKRKISFPVVGGRDFGYRGYSSVLVYPGRWRVRVETSRGEVLGIERFDVVISAAPVLMKSENW